MPVISFMAVMLCSDHSGQALVVMRKEEGAGHQEHDSLE